MRSIAQLLRAFGDVEKATLARELVEDPKHYRFELKYDGYRILAIKSGDAVRLFSRNGKDWTGDFPSVAAAVAKLACDECVLDGEVCALDERGHPSFNLLQNRLAARGRPTLSYPVFDLLILDGRDVRGLPLEERRALLEGLFAKAKAPLALSTTIEGDPDEILEALCAQGLEGLIAKRKGSRYVSGRTRDWLKLKCTHRQEFALVGYLPFTGTTDRVGSLLLAIVGDDGAFHYAGKVGTGFDNATRRALAEQLDAHRVDAPPATGTPRIRIAHFAEPRLVGEVEFTEWTPDGKIRHPSFLGLRRDKSPRECVREDPLAKPKPRPRRREARAAKPPTRGAKMQTTTRTPRATTKRTAGSKRKTTRRATKRTAAKPDGDSSARAVAITNPQKILFPREGITKEEIVAYYRAIAEVMLPHLEGRPLALQRWPQGIHGHMWFQQNAPAKVPEFVRLVAVDDRQHVVAENVETLEWLANLAALTLHQWASRAPREGTQKTKAASLDRPDYVVFDLDPGEGTWAHLVETASALRRLLDALELESVPKTSGKRGLHVFVPIARTHDFDDVVTFAEKIANAVAATLPKLATTTRTKSRRGGRLYVDYLQNGRGKTVVAPYTLRALDGAPVSTPLKWSEVTEKLDPSTLTLRTVLRRVERHGDLFAGVLRSDAKLPKLTSPRARLRA